VPLELHFVPAQKKSQNSSNQEAGNSNNPKIPDKRLSQNQEIAYFLQHSTTLQNNAVGIFNSFCAILFIA